MITLTLILTLLMYLPPNLNPFFKGTILLWHVTVWRTRPETDAHGFTSDERLLPIRWEWPERFLAHRANDNSYRSGDPWALTRTAIKYLFSYHNFRSDINIKVSVIWNEKKKHTEPAVKLVGISCLTRSGAQSDHLNVFELMTTPPNCECVFSKPHTWSHFKTYLTIFRPWFYRTWAYVKDMTTFSPTVKKKKC